MEAAVSDQAAGNAASPASKAASAHRRAFAYGLIAFALVACLPLLPVNNYILAATVRALIFISLGQAWNVVAGIGGLLSLGHGVFLGLGCYTTGILFKNTVSRRGSAFGAASCCRSWSRWSWAA